MEPLSRVRVGTECNRHARGGGSVDLVAYGHAGRAQIGHGDVRWHHLTYLCNVRVIVSLQTVFVMLKCWDSVTGVTNMNRDPHKVVTTTSLMPCR